jgi:hypothetical protein
VAVPVSVSVSVGNRQRSWCTSFFDRARKGAFDDITQSSTSYALLALALTLTLLYV